MSWLFIEPTDVWLFRDGKPFDAGSEHRARTLFPANPTTIQGVIRSELLLASDAPLPDFGRGKDGARDSRSHAVSGIIGWPGEPPRFKLRGPFVARRGRDQNDNEHYVRYFPVPADVVKVKGGDHHLFLAPIHDGPFQANWPQEGLLPLWARTSATLEEASGWVSETDLHVCLNSGPAGAPVQFHVLHNENLFAHESRFGVGLDSRVKRPQEGLLYQVEFARPRPNVGLLVEVDDSELPSRVQWPADRLIGIGGETRGGYYTVLNRYNPPPPPPLPAVDGKARLRLYFATPSWFAGGWTAVDWSAWLSGSNLRLVAAAVPRAQPIGGARIDAESQRGNFQKVMHRYVPAGSVFFFEADGAVNYTGEPVIDSADEGKIGFGQVFLGAWDYA